MKGASNSPQVQGGGGLPQRLVGERQQQAEGVAVGGDRVRAGVALLQEALGEERLEEGGQGAHGSAPSARWSLRPTSAISSGAAVRYQ